MKEVLPDFDEDRVYTSDLKKIFHWYNQLLDNNLLKDDASHEAEEDVNNESSESE